MSVEFFENLNQLSSIEIPITVTTVIRFTGSISANFSNNSIIDSQGKTIFGWVGRGCAEKAVRCNALDSIKDGQKRIVSLDLDNKVIGAGMPCGGKTDVYVEPYLLGPGIHLLDRRHISEVLSELAHLMHFMVTYNNPTAVLERFPYAYHLITCYPDFKQLEVGPNTFVVVITTHKEDQYSIKKALEQHPGPTLDYKQAPTDQNSFFNTF